MYGHTHGTDHDQKYFTKWLKFHRLELPVCDRAFAPTEDPGVVRYPSDSSAFVPFVEEESLKGYVRIYTAVHRSNKLQENSLLLPSLQFLFLFLYLH